MEGKYPLWGAVHHESAVMIYSLGSAGAAGAGEGRAQAAKGGGGGTSRGAAARLRVRRAAKWGVRLLGLDYLTQLESQAHHGCKG